jgi:ComF family protein
MNILREIRDLLPSLIDFIYPPLCVVCLGSPGNRGETVCRKCWMGMLRIDPGDPVWRELYRRVNSTGSIGGFLSVYLFEKGGALQECLHQLKYGGLRSVGERLGAEVGAAILSEPLFRRADLLMPVPLHPVRMRERGYNQSEIISAGAARLTGLPVATGVMRRVRNTPSQTSLTMRERELNVRGAFALKRGAVPLVRKKRVILVDDVLTTGATFRACGGVLASAGAGEILAASAAIAP